MTRSHVGTSASSRRRPSPTKTRQTTPEPSATPIREAAPARRRAAATQPRARQSGRSVQATTEASGPLGDSNVIAFLATTDAARARTFYETVVGLRFVADEPFALVFEANGVMVRIQKVEVVTPARYTALGWNVADIATTIRRLNANGVQCARYAGLAQDTLGVWASPSGACIAWFSDPDGHILSLTQW